MDSQTFLDPMALVAPPPSFAPVPAGVEQNRTAVSAHSQPSETSDDMILARVARGDLEAFAQFYDRHSSLLYSLAVKILRDPDEADEVLQEAMVLIWERASSYEAALGKALSWAVTITRNKAVDRLRSAQRKARLLAEAAPEMEAQFLRDDAPAGSRAAMGENVTIIRQVLTNLPREQRQAIEMAFLGGMTHTEIAAQLGQPLGTIKARIRRGMMALKDTLEDKL